MDGGAWWAAVHGVAEESDMTERLHFYFSLSCIGEGNGNPLQCSCLENPRDGVAWWAAVCGVAQSRTRLKQLSSSSSSNLCVYQNSLKTLVKHTCWSLTKISDSVVLGWGLRICFSNIFSGEIEVAWSGTTLWEILYPVITEKALRLRGIKGFPQAHKVG